MKKLRITLNLCKMLICLIAVFVTALIVGKN